MRSNRPASYSLLICPLFFLLLWGGNADASECRLSGEFESKKNIEKLYECAKKSIYKFYGDDLFDGKGILFDDQSDVILKGRIEYCYISYNEANLECFLLSKYGNKYHVYVVLFNIELEKLTDPLYDRHNFTSKEFFYNYRDEKVQIGGIDGKWRKLQPN